jgi:uncharacterized membrane protein YhaH (DUF805 family)
MDWKWLYTSFEGRISRKHFWLGAIVLAIGGIVLSFIIMSIFGVGMMMNPATMFGAIQTPEEAMALTTRSSWASLIVYLVMTYPSLALMLKRRHDRSNAGNDVWVYMGLAVVMLLAQALGIGYEVSAIGDYYVAMPSVWFSVFGGIVGIFAIYLLVVLGFLKGHEGENAYGRDPLTSAP